MKSIMKKMMAWILSLSMILSLGVGKGVKASEVSTVVFGSPTWVNPDTSFQFTEATTALSSSAKTFCLSVTAGSFTVGSSILAGSTAMSGITSDYSYVASVSTTDNLVSLTVTGSEMTAESIQVFLRGVLFTYSTGMKISVSANSLTLDDNMTSLVIDGATHYYKYVSYGNDSETTSSNRMAGCPIAWDTAYNAAKAAHFNGLTGYLATITSATEHSFIFQNLNGCQTDFGSTWYYSNQTSAHNAGWIGGTRFTPAEGYAFGDSTISMSTTATDSWKWADGPEADTDFNYSNWSGGQPDGGSGNGVSDTEGYAQYGFGTSGQWNDLSIGNKYQSENSPAKVFGYYIEYSAYGNQAETVLPTMATVTLEDSSTILDDTTAPVLSNVTESATLGSSLLTFSATSNEDGKIYFLPKGESNYTTVESLENAFLNSGAFSACKAGVELSILVSFYNFTAGNYQAYAVDNSGNVSAPAEIVLLEEPAPVLSDVTSSAIVGSTVNATSDKDGTLIFLPKGASDYSTVDELTNAYYAYGGKSVSCTAGVAVSIDTAGLLAGNYQIYALSNSGKVSAPAEIVLLEEPAPVLSDVTSSAIVGSTVSATSDKDGTLIFLPKGAADYSTVDELTNAYYAYGGKSVSCTAGVAVSIDTPGLLAGNYQVYALDNSGNMSAPAAVTLTTAAPAAPSVTAEDTNNVITGIDNTMEYSIDGGSWTTYDAENPPDLSGSHSVQVRVAETETTPAGEMTTISFTMNEAVENSAPMLTATNVNISTTMDEDTYASGFKSTCNFEDRVDVTTNGGSTAYSAVEGTATLTVNAVNDAPMLLNTGSNRQLDFDGANDYLSVEDMHLDHSFTVEAWINMKDYAHHAWSRIFDFGNGQGTYNELLTFDFDYNSMCSNGVPRFSIRDDNGNEYVLSATKPLTLGEWTYITVVYDETAQKMSIYLNGELNATATAVISKTALTRQYNYFGKSNWAQDSYLDASMFGIAVWNDARSASEIQSDMSACRFSSFNGSESNLVLFYPFSEAAGATSVSSATEEYTGILNNGLALTKLTYSSTTPTGEGYMLDTDANRIIIWAKNFSTYAIAYGVSSSSEDTGSSGGSYSSSFSVTVNAGEHGSMSPSGTISVTKGASKTFTITPDEDYVISDVLVDGKSVGAVSSYTLSNITAAHTITAVFAKTYGLPYYYNDVGTKVFIGFASDDSGTMQYIAPDGETVLFQENPKDFIDISSHWGKSYIDFVTEREVFVGTGTNIFSPDMGMTRAMLATVIGRLYKTSYGELETTGSHVFSDCDYSSWYGGYVDWCAENGIIKGVGGSKFEPDRQVTRQEMAAMLYRFAEFMKESTAISSGKTLSYSDASDIASWAQQAALYCQETGIITGRDGNDFAPTQTATRAEVAAILDRFIEIVV